MVREGRENVQNRHRKLDRYYEKYGVFVEKILIVRTDGDRKKAENLAVKLWSSFYMEMDTVTGHGEDGIRAWLYAAAGYWCQKESAKVPDSGSAKRWKKVFGDLPEGITPESVISWLLFENDRTGLSEAERILVLCAGCGIPCSDELQGNEESPEEAMEAAVEKYRKRIPEKWIK